MQMAFDTLKAVKELKAAGFEEAQAEAMVGAFGLAVSDNTASKADVQALRDDVAGLKTDMRALDGKVDRLHADLDGKIDLARSDLGGDIRLLKWMNGAILALAAAAFLRFVFMA
ncbi:hypothetical protein [Rubrimonas cliftonensis]|uniref:DUF1640 domain-containing protein n=1 Tax=Rubrimonas cliftonensis TaxID=89524 RepID=A0A1H4ER81_9RHOB|nr:hypothetical protein [Rubrimonas cliftonensis]SEA87369.1 hypothetical protein SAMN05444370_11546 [Rubrimonas cliftonensis]